MRGRIKIFLFLHNGSVVRVSARLGVKATNSKAKARGVKAKAKALTSKAKAKDLASKAKAKDLTAKAKDLAPHPPIRSRPRYSQYITPHSLEPHYLKVLMIMQVCVVKKKKTVKKLVLIVQLYVLVALQKYQVCQHLITHSCSMWPHKETAMTEDTFHGCRCCWRAENFLQQVVQDTKAGFLQDSFPWT